jgi:hypothetical protein
MGPDETYGTKQFFNEEDYITAWAKVTSGNALQQLHNMIHSKYSLAKFLKFWEELYSKTRSITDQQEIIDSFWRKKKEALVAAMLRVTVDINQMEYAKDPAAWNGIRDKQWHDVLMKIILPETFSYLRSRREAHEKNGYLLKVDEMIQEAHTFEQSYNYVPQKDYPEHDHIPSANNSIMSILSWIPRGNFQNKPQPMEVALHNHHLQLLLTPNNNNNKEAEQHRNNLMINIVDNHNSRDQDPTVHLDGKAQLHALKVKARQETSMTKTIEDSQRRINIKTRSDRHRTHHNIDDNSKVNRRMDHPYQIKVTSVRKQEKKQLTWTLAIKTNSTNVRQRDIVKNNISGQ